MKKDSKLAREAIRWLETQFKQGNRYLLLKYPEFKVSISWFQVKESRV